jgi:hypothetical protein
MSKRKAILVDINGTLSDVSEVVHFIKGAEKDWIGFFNNMNKVKPNPMVQEFIKRFSPGNVIVLVSGAPDTYQDQTIEWLKKHNIEYDDIFFRPTWDKRRGWQFKKSLLNNKLSNLYSIQMALDDKQDACKMWIENGIPCWKLPSDMDEANRPPAAERFRRLVTPRVPKARTPKPVMNRIRK